MRGGRARVLHVAKVTGISGAENHLLLLLPALDRQRYDVSFAVLTDPRRPAPEFRRRLEQAGIHTHAVPIRGDADPLCLLRLARLMRRGRYRLVHTHMIHGDLYGAVAAKLSGVARLVSSKHNDNLFKTGPLYRLLGRALSHQADAVVTISRWLAEFTRLREGVPRRKIEVIPYGLDEAALGRPRPGALRQEFGLSDDALLFGIVARLTAQKGHRYLFEAFARLAGERPEAALLVVGDGELRGACQAQVASLGLGSRVIFTGYRPDIANVMSGLDVFVHPSLWEGFGLVFLEAMALSLPVIATTVSAIPEIVVPGETGLLVPPRDSAALAEAMERLAADPELRRHMGEAGHERLQRQFTTQAMVAKTEALYDRLLRH